MAKIIIEIEDKPGGGCEVVAKSNRPLPENYRDHTDAEAMACRIWVLCVMNWPATSRN